MIKYFFRQYWRYIAMALAFASITFLTNACEVNAQTYTYYLNDAKANLYLNNQLQSSVSYNSVNDNVWSYNFSATWGNNIRIVNQNALNLGHADIVLFNMRFHYTIGDTQTFSNINSVGFSDEACYYGVTNQAGANNSSRDTYITAICFLDQDLNFASGSNVANVSFDWSSINYFNISNITVVDNKDTARELKTKIDTLSGKIDSANTHLIDINTNLTWLNQTLLREEVLLQSIKTNTDNIYTYVQWIDGLLENIQGYIQSGNAQAHTDAQAQTNATNNINNSINDSSTDDPSNDLNDMSSNEASNSVISDLLLLPVNMFQKILNSINGTCSTFSLGALFGTNLTLPCINIENHIGSTLWGAIDVIFCGMFMLSMRKKFVDIFQNITSLKDRGNELE